MSAKIERIQKDIDKAKEKISEFQTRLKELERQKTEQENTEIVEAVRGMDISLSDLAAFLKAARASATSGIGVPAKPASWGEEEQTERTVFGAHAAEGVERSLQRRGPKATGSIGKEDSEE